MASCLKTINNKNYGVDLVCFTSHPTTVIYFSKNGWDGMLSQHRVLFAIIQINLAINTNSLFRILEASIIA